MEIRRRHCAQPTTLLRASELTPSPQPTPSPSCLRRWRRPTGPTGPTGGGAEGKGELSGAFAIEPFASVHVVNGRTKATFKGTVTAERTLKMEFEALPGDPLSIKVTDRNGRSTDLGLITFGGQPCHKPHQRPC